MYAIRSYYGFKLFYNTQFVFRQQIALKTVHTDQFSNSPSSVFIVAGEHHGFYTKFLEFVDRFDTGILQSIGYCEKPLDALFSYNFV